MKDRAQIEGMINGMEIKLKETKESLIERGPVTDTLKIVIPMMEDQLKIMRALAEG